MSMAFTLPPAFRMFDCLRILEGAMPWRRRSARSAASSAAKLLPFRRLPFLSRPSHLKGKSRLMVLTLAVAACAMCLSPALLNRDAVDFLDAGEALFDLLEPR